MAFFLQHNKLDSRNICGVDNFPGFTVTCPNLPEEKTASNINYTVLLVDLVFVNNKTTIVL